MLDITKKTFRTSDLYFAAFLKTAGFNLADIESSKDNRKKIFIYEDNNNLILKTRTDYINGDAKVSAKNLIDNIRALKTLTIME